MKILSILVAAFLIACESQPTMQELEDEALRTGDWSAVEQKDRMAERMQIAPELKCPEHLIRICIQNGEHEECYCQPRG